jgi:PAS domain S-box-containing protein
MDQVSQRKQELERQLRRLSASRAGEAPGDAPLDDAVAGFDFRRLFDQHKAIMYLVDFKSLRLLDANQACLDFYGYSRQEFLGLSITDLNPLPREEILRQIAGFDAQNLGCYLFRHRLKNGGMRDVEVRSTPIGLPDGREVYFAVVHDITERMRREDELRQSEERYRLLVENARELVAVIQGGVIRYINPRALPVTGYTSQELIGRAFLEFVAPEDREPLRQRYQARLEGKPLPETFDCRVLNRAGQIIWLEISGVRILWEGQPATLSFFTDVTQRRQAEEERVLSERLQAAIETAGAACHELNQPLQALLSHLELVHLKLPGSHPQRQAVAVALDQAAKLADITQRLNRLTDYRTRQYLSRQRILDLEGSSAAGPPGAGDGPGE